MLETDFLWMGAAVLVPLVWGALLALCPKSWSELARWSALTCQALTLGILIGIQIQFRYDTIERWGVLADPGTRWLGSLSARMERLDLLPDYAIRPFNDWVVRFGWISQPNVSLLWTLDGSNLWLAICLGAVFIASGIMTFGAGATNGGGPANGGRPAGVRFCGLLLTLQACAHLALFAGDFLTLALGWGFLGLVLVLFLFEARGEAEALRADRGILSRLGIWLVGILALLCCAAGLATTWNVRPVAGPDLLQARNSPGTPNDPQQWSTNPVTSLEFPTLQRLALAQLETHFTHKPIDEIDGLLLIKRLQGWLTELKEPKGNALRRPMIPGLTRNQIEDAILLEQGRAVEALAKPPQGFQSQSALFLLLAAAAWLILGLPPFTGMWVPLMRHTRPSLGMALGTVCLALSCDLLFRVAIPLAPLALATQLSTGALWLGAAGTFVVWNLASTQSHPQKALAMITGLPLFALFTYSLPPLSPEGSASNGWSWGACGQEYLCGASLVALALLLCAIAHLGRDWQSFEGTFGRSPRATLALSVGLLAFLGMPGLAPFVGWFLAGMSLAGQHTLSMFFFFGGLAYGAWVAMKWLTRMFKTTTEPSSPGEPFGWSGAIAATVLGLLLLLGGIQPGLVLNWLEPGATAKVELLNKAANSTQP